MNGMKLKPTCVPFLLFVSIGNVSAQPPPADPFSDSLFPPELVMQSQSEIALSEEQKTALIAEMHKAEERFNDLHQQLQKEAQSLAALLEKEPVDEPAAAAQFDKMLKRENEIKRRHFALALAIKNSLSAEQRAKLKEIKKKIAAGEIRSPEERQRLLQGKVKKVQEGVERWQLDGRDPTPIGEMMQEFEPLMKQGRHKEAEAVLDRALKLLDPEGKDKKEKSEK
jgi:Spy/CpxP family protein refolding chaperone